MYSVLHNLSEKWREANFFMMFWRMTGLSTASPVETILDKADFTLEELLQEDEIIQECKALNSRLINFLRERPQVEQLIRYIVEEEGPEDAEMRPFRLPFIACEILTCEVDVLLKTLVEDDELLNLFFSFVEPNRLHSTLLAGYFSKVVVCLLSRKTVPLLQYIQFHQEIIKKMIDLIGITSIMEVLVRLIGADEHIYTNCADTMRWFEDTDVADLIVDKFNSSDSPEVHANAAEILCAITRYAPPGLVTIISSPSFIGNLFRNALDQSRPRSVLVNSLAVCISLLDPKRLTIGIYPAYNRQLTPTSTVTSNPEVVDGMLEILGPLLELLNVSSEGTVLPTTYGKLQPPLGKHRLKIVEFVSILLSVGGEAAENKLMQLGAVNLILDLFFKYPYNNFLHHFVEDIVIACLESKNGSLVKHILGDCNLIEKILDAEKHSTLTSDSDKPTVAVDGIPPSKIGNIGHLTRISNKIVHLGSTNGDIQTVLQGNNEWVEWQSNVLSRRNAMENVYQWACGRPSSLQERTRDSDDDDYQDRDFDVAALANNLSAAFRYGVYSNDMEEGPNGSHEQDDEDVYFDNESAEVVLSSLRLGGDHDSSSIFTNTNWFAFEDDQANGDETGAPTLTLDTEDTDATSSDEDQEAIGDEATDTSFQKPGAESMPTESSFSGLREVELGETDKPPESVELSETSCSGNASDAGQLSSLPKDASVEEAMDEEADVPHETTNLPLPVDNVLDEAGAGAMPNEPIAESKVAILDPGSTPHPGQGAGEHEKSSSG
ncbi:hypothetical protein Droror1_Dr00007990 [Drosera rotundifolia]